MVYAEKSTLPKQRPLKVYYPQTPKCLAWLMEEAVVLYHRMIRTAMNLNPSHCWRISASKFSLVQFNPI